MIAYLALTVSRLNDWSRRKQWVDHVFVDHDPLHDWKHDIHCTCNLDRCRPVNLLLDRATRYGYCMPDLPGPQGQQQHTTSWFVEAIHRARSFGGGATVLADYALTTNDEIYRGVW